MCNFDCLDGTGVAYATAVRMYEFTKEKITHSLSSD